MKNTFKLSLIAAAIMASNPAFSGDPKIAFLGGFTGPLESLTPPIYQGAQLAIDQANAQGGVLNGNKINLLKGDSTCADATAASNVADRMINSEKVSAIVGPMCSGATIAAANNAAIPGGAVLISPSATSPALTNLKDNDLVFRTAPSDAYQGKMMAKLLMSKGINEVVISYVNNDYGKGFAESLAASFKSQGGNVASSEAHEDGKADYRAELGSLASMGASTLVVLAYADGSGQTILRQAMESGDFEQFVGGDGMVGDKLIDALGGDINLIATKPGSPNLKGKAPFVKAAKAAGMDPEAVFSAQAYDAAFLIALAIEAAGSDDRAAIAKTIRKVASAPGVTILPGEWKKAVKAIKDGKDINYQGASGNHEFDSAGDVPGIIVEMTVKNGKFVQLGQIK
ncbi:MAG: ABC transporter substrate-binding protein [Gammaproteobacteria bacterium]|nr:ABC transporter substrate-binding protein [Gammaproteobacteria bacterium]